MSSQLALPGSVQDPGETPGLDGAAPAASRASALAGSGRLHHVDAMRPVKQLGVVSTHSMIYFAPGASVTAGGALLLTHVTREAFLFISACMLTYAYRDLRRDQLRHFYTRRLTTIGLPYLAWTAVYFAIGESISPQGPVPALGHLATLLGTGYYQLYYLVVIGQFYLVFPLFLWLLRASRRHHGTLLAASAAWQVAFTVLAHWNILGFGWFEGFGGIRVVSTYQLYLVAGSLAALHYRQVDAWLRSHGRLVVAGLVGSTALAEAWYALGVSNLVPAGVSVSDDLQPMVVPFFLAAIASLYLVGVAMVGPRRPRWAVSLAMSGSDASYGIYLAQMVFIVGLSRFGWGSLARDVPWEVVVLGSLAITFVGGWLLSMLLARTPLAQVLAGRPRVRRRTRGGGQPRADRAGGGGGWGARRGALRAVPSGLVDLRL